MRQVVVHSVLLLVALVVAYGTWTRNDVTALGPDSVLLWSADDVSGVRYTAPTRRVAVEPREDETGPYVWVTIAFVDTTGARSDSVLEFPGDDQAHDLLETYATLRAVRELGALDEEGRSELELADSRITLDVGVDGETHELLVGGTVFASGDRYVEDRETGRAYVLPASTVSWLASAEGVLVERSIHPPIMDRVATVTVRTERGERTMQRVEGASGADATWVSPDAPGRTDQSFTTFMDRLEQLSIVSYVPDLDRSVLSSLANVIYANASGEPVDRLELLRSDEGDEPVYYVVTDHTRIPGRVYSGLAEPVDSDLTQLF